VAFTRGVWLNIPASKIAAKAAAAAAGLTNLLGIIVVVLSGSFCIRGSYVELGSPAKPNGRDEHSFVNWMLRVGCGVMQGAKWGKEGQSAARVTFELLA
jgi:hypothetical protein